MKTALITNQDGYHLAELLLEKGYAEHGIKRRASSFNTHQVIKETTNLKTNNKNSFQVGPSQLNLSTGTSCLPGTSLLAIYYYLST